MKSFLRVIFLSLVIVIPVAAQETVTNESLRRGLEEIRVGDFEEAASIFREILNNPAMEAFHADALYWLVKADIATGRYGEASRAVYRSLVMYPSHEHNVEMQYQSARLLYLEGESEKAIIALGDYIDTHAGSEFAPSALYWVGESLIALGRLEEADAVFENLLSSHPSSVKREAARYRRSEISLLFRERELLDLLKWSHEEYLLDAEEFYRRETEYREALITYREQIGDGTDADSLRVRRERLLDAKKRLLAVQRYYVEQLLRLSDVQ